MIIPNNGELNINDLPVGGYRRNETLECLSDVPYRGRVPKAYWKYTDNTFEDHKVDDIRCKGDKCKSPYIGWQSAMGIYKKGDRYYHVLRLGRRFENASKGLFTCYFEGCLPVSIEIGECEVKIIIVVSFLSGLYIVKRCMNACTQCFHVWARIIILLARPIMPYYCYM